MSTQELQDPNDAVPASTAAALDMTAGAAAPFVVRELTPDALTALVGSLSVSARKALGVAEALRNERRADAVHMEHLLVGLQIDEGGHQRELLEAVGLYDVVLADRLAAFELPLDTSSVNKSPERLLVRSAEPVERMPPLSAHVTLALSAAAAIADWQPTITPQPGLVHVRHLLAGWLGVRDCHVVAAFDQERAALAVRIGDRIGEMAQTQSPGIARAQVDRVDALLDDPPRVIWERLAPAPPPTLPTPPTPAGPRIGTGGGAANDRAEGEDRLGFAHYVQAFANLIDSPDTRPPLTIGIFGAWGSGKSFLLRHLTDELDRRGARLRPPAARALGGWLRRRLQKEPPDTTRAFVYCVAFNAWEYNAADHIWPRLVRRVLDSVTRNAEWRPFRWAQQIVRKFRRNFSRKLRGDWQQLVAVAFVGATLWWTFRYLRPNDAEAFAQRVLGVDTSDSKFSVPAIFGGILAIVELLRKVLFAPLGGWVTAMLDDGPGYGNESDFVRAVRADLDLVDQQLVSENARILIVIDDLDRCEPDKAVEVLQAINLLLDRRSFVVCLGIDARVITAAVEKHYEELLGPAGITGYEYLDKIIQIPFRIPDPTSDELALFVSKQLGDPLPTQPGRGTVGASVRTALASPEDAAITPRDRELQAATARGVGVARQLLDGPLGALASATAGLPLALNQGLEVVTGFATPIPAAPPTLSFTHDELVAFKDVAACLRPNPRHVKRLVNVYALVRSLAELAGNRVILDDPGATVRWLTLCAQWPYAARAMLLHLDAHGPPDPTATTLPPLRWLYDAVRPALDPGKRARFDHDAAALELLTASSDGLSWDELRVLRAYTVNFNPALDAELRADLREPPRRRAHPGASARYDRRHPAGGPAAGDSAE